MQRRRVLMGMQSELPGAYRRVEFIAAGTDANNSGQYIDTGLYPNDTTKVECGFEYISIKPYQAVFGTQGGMFSFGTPNSSTVFRVNVGGIRTDITTSGIVRKWDLVMQTTVVALNGQIFALTSQTITITSTMWLFGVRTSSGRLDSTCNIRIYYFRIWDNGTLKRNFIPCIRKADNKPGMYDTVTKTFFINAGMGEFIVPA